MTWLDAIKHMVEFYQSEEVDMPDVVIQAGKTGQEPVTKNTIFVLRDVDTRIDLVRSLTSGATALWVELWVPGDINPLKGYENLDSLETKFFAALPNWAIRLGRDLGIAAKVTVPHLVGDGEKKRPRCGSQATILIEWKR